MVFLIRYTTGIICTPMLQAKAQALNLPPMVETNHDTFSTAFTVSCDHVDSGTGVSAVNRSKTVRALSDPTSTADHFRRPGHIFPLVSRPGGVLERRGHTESCTDMCKLVGLKSVVGCISELMNDDGTMMRLSNCVEFSLKWNLCIITVQHLVTYIQSRKLASEIPSPSLNSKHEMVFSAECELPIGFYQFGFLGVWKMKIFTSLKDRSEIAVVSLGDLSREGLLTRVHSGCFTGNVFGSLRCDCGPQLAVSAKMIESEGHGMILYISSHEGRGIGLANKIRAYQIQSEEFLDTYEANHKIGFPQDMRTYHQIAEIFSILGVKNITLLTNDVQKIEQLQNYVSSTKPVEVGDNAFNSHYLNTKKDKQRALAQNSPSPLVQRHHCKRSQPSSQPPPPPPQLLFQTPSQSPSRSPSQSPPQSPSQAQSTLLHPFPFVPGQTFPICAQDKK
eukprot:TRINITY_DN4488_c0_g1_i1.p1 TRINITY_DN4488_c0_g1~~TRINITY_DN4488_c0_g1_i1.p1  ORF type:complete len:448 (-),score=76.62 TRINITY_DN4488_c0_g1_i1:51-1394(-)